MGDAHQRFEQLAVDHVLGGLSDAEASTFRGHLVACRDCRRRVAELRDIAAGLEATEREERLHAELSAVLEGAQRRGWTLDVPLWVRAGAAVVVLAIIGLGFWTYHLRRVVGEYSETLVAQETVLEVIAGGEPLPSEADEVTIVAAERDGTVAVLLGALPTLPSDRLVLLWLVAGDDVVDQRLLAYGALTEDTDVLPFTVEPGDATTLVISVERRGDGRPGTPSAEVLGRVQLQP
jgi:anti-sigma-K factor RskA